MTIVVLYASNTQVLTLKGLYSGGDTTTGPLVWQNAASVTATLNDVNDSPVAGLTNLTMTYVPKSNGWYQCTVPSSFSPIPDVNYTLVIDADVGFGHLHREYPAVVQTADQ